MNRFARALCLLVTALGLACGGSGGGAASSSLDIALSPLAQVSPSDIVSIRLTVFDSAGVQVATETEPFTLGASTIFDLFIPPGTGYRFVAEALDANGEVIYRGSATADVGESGVVDLTIQLVSLVPDCNDADGDGYGDPGSASCDAGLQRDCDDANGAVNPGAEDVCNDVDDNCNGQVDERGVCDVACVDLDGDGYGRPGDPACPAGALPDCNDDDATIFPRADELCNGVDDDCDGRTDEGFDQDFDGFTVCNGDCDDASNQVFPGATETCNDRDDDCDTLIDEDDVCLEPCLDADQDGYGASGGPECPAGPEPDCDDTNPAIHPAATELCDGVDNNCVSGIDEGFDQDGDTYTTCNGDCDDTDPGIHPGATEVCDGLDQNCDGVADSDGPIGPDYYVDAANTSQFQVGSAACGFGTIQDGVDAAANGRTVFVASGNYGPFTLSGRSNLTISGGSPRPTVSASGQAVIALSGSTGISMRNLQIVESYGGGQYIGGAIDLSASSLALGSSSVQVPFSAIVVDSTSTVQVQGASLQAVGSPRVASSERATQRREGTRGVTISGVDVNGGTATVTNTTIADFESGLDCTSGATCTANGATTIQNCGGEAVFCGSSSTCTVGGSTQLTGTFFDGLVCTNGASCTLGGGASATGNGASGVYCETAGTCVVQGTVTGNAEIGVYCEEACTVSGATVTGNTTAAIYTDADSTIQNSTIGDTVPDVDVVADGLELDESGFSFGATIQGNTIRNNADNGIECFGGRAGTRGVTTVCSGNTFVNNGTDVAAFCGFICTP